MDKDMAEEFGMDMEQIAENYDWDIQQGVLIWSIAPKDTLLRRLSFGEEIPALKERREIIAYQKAALAKAAAEDAPSGNQGSGGIKPPTFKK